MQIPSFNKILGINNEEDREKKALKKALSNKAITIIRLTLSRKCTNKELLEYKKVANEYLSKYGTEKEKLDFEIKYNKLQKILKL